MEGKLELISRYDEYYLVKSISNEDISLDDILLHNESGRIISVNGFGESNGSKTIMDTGVRNPIELVISGNTFKKLIGYYSKYQKLPLSKLSLKNCEAVANGYDLDELISHELQKLPYQKHVDDGQYNDGQLSGFELGAEWGFQKALEILGDKKFSEDDVRLMLIDMARFIATKELRDDWDLDVDAFFRKRDFFIDKQIQSLQQTEWDVEIKMVFNHIPKNNGIHNAHTIESVPKLDENGCLILKRK